MTAYSTAQVAEVLGIGTDTLHRWLKERKVAAPKLSFVGGVKVRLCPRHCHAVTSAVRDHMRAFATCIGWLRPFCVIDGADTIRILKAYGRLGFGDGADGQSLTGANP
jgi:excisionase family DNA binding protein